MRWKFASIRRFNDFCRNAEAWRCPVLELGGLELVPAGLAGPGFAQLAASTEQSRPGVCLKTSAEKNSRPETPFSAQPSDPNGVSEGMATLVLDNPALGAGLAAQPDEGATAPGEPSGDAAIMLRAAEGDEAAFSFLVEKYHRPIIHFLYRMARNQEVAEELAQEVFLRVYRARQSYRAQAKFTTWLYRIAANLAVNYARDTRHEREAQSFSLDAPDKETGTKPEVAGSEPSVEQSLLREERMKAIRAQVMALPERQRMAVVMHKYQEMDYREIGKVLNLSESATKSLLFRAYQTLRERLKDFV
jgi:RNA polymerase sigma-70 factor (ECF subfamily)